MRNRNGNPSTPGPGLRTIVRAEQRRVAAERKAVLTARQAATLKAMAKGVK